MKCPTCKETKLVMTERQGIEIDYCPDCRGVWLDRGELDKLIEKSAAAAPTPQPQPQQPQPQPQYYRSDDRYKDEYKYKRHKSFLSEIFD